MAQSSEYVDWLLDELSSLGTLRAKSMFGAYGIYCDTHFFAIVSSEVLYVKVDDIDRQAFIERGLRPFTYPMKDGSFSQLSYYPLPDEAFENTEVLCNWAKKGLSPALRAKKPTKQRKK